jgi:hypothetical protein
MATLTVTQSTDFSAQALTNIDRGGHRWRRPFVRGCHAACSRAFVTLLPPASSIPTLLSPIVENANPPGTAGARS